MELLFAAAVFGLVLWQMIKTNSTEKLAILIFMGLVLTFPFYVLISSYKDNPATSGKSITAVSSTNSVQSTASDMKM
jgi:predicted neutral ceramidase superfamily lipid hydrolase